MAQAKTFLLSILIAFLLGHQSVWSQSSPGIEQESIDFIKLRMAHVLRQTPDHMLQLRPYLQNELNSNPIYKGSWDEASAIFEERKGQLISPGFEGIPPEYHIALIAYTISDNHALYRDFNSKTRALCSEFDIKTYPYKSFFKLLNLAIDSLSLDPKFQNLKPAYWRGTSLEFAYRVGQDVAFQSFTSTSVDMEIAEQYSGNVTVYEISGPIPKSIYVYHHSKFQEEEEVLVSPLVTYKVTHIEFGSETKPYITHSLEPTSSLNVKPLIKA